MIDDILTRALRIDDERRAAVFRKPHLLRLLNALARSESSAREAADAASMKLNLACYHLERLCELGLVERCGTRKRPGRSSILYRARSAAFFVPSEFAKCTVGEELSRELRSAIDRSNRSLSGELFFADEQGRMQSRKIAERSGGEAPSGSELWLRCRLRPDEARSMMIEMRQLLDRYASRSAGGRNYLVHAALAPVSDEG